MKTLEAKNHETAEDVFCAIIIIALLLLNLPGSATAILFFSAVASATYLVMFRESLRDHRGRLTAAVCFVVAVAAAAGAAVAFSLSRGHWY
jgi:hypothetical protein